MKKYISLLIFSLVSIITVYAQKPVTWTFGLADKGNGEIDLVCSAKIAPGWHLYDISIPEGGPNPTTLSIDELKGATKIGDFKAINSKLHKGYDDLFEMEIGYYSNQATFIQRLKVTDKNTFSLKGDVRSQACNDSECTPPLPNDFEFSSKNLPSSLIVAANSTTQSESPEVNQLDTNALQNESVSDSLSIASVSASSDNTDSNLWAPVIKELKEYGSIGTTDNSESLLFIFLGGLAGGFLALLTPCVWPMIPMTVSFFLKRNKKDKKKSIRDAITYGLGIIIIYISLGLIVTAVFGASALNDLSTSAVFNLIFFALLIFFAISFLGAFDLVLPASWTSKMDSKADSTTGIISIFFMAFTLALVSFSCTGPLIGLLLVQAATSGDVIAPIIGMFGFALALAIPFSLFAIFPSLIDSSRKSAGGWLNSVKVVLGFIELALALKFLSVADLAYGWHILDREVFLVLWIVIFTLLGIYLLGKIKFPHDSELKHVSIPRLFLAIISLSFALYMVPGLWGAPLKAISAFSPPINTQDFNLYDGDVHAMFDDYEAGMNYAKQHNKPVIIDFSGYGCVNCRKMEASVWTDPRVKKMLEKDYVLITLMVDDKQKLPKEIVVTEENGKTSKLKTVGDKWSYLERHKFGVNSQPFYVLLNDEGKPIGPAYAYDENVDRYIEFLKTGLKNFEK